MTPLAAAKRYGQEEIMRMLREKGAQMEVDQAQREDVTKEEVLPPWKIRARRSTVEQLR